MVSSRRQSKQRFIVTVLVLASVSAITLYYRGHARTAVSGARSVALDVMDPIGHLVAGIVHPVEHFIQGSLSYGSLSRENVKLEQEIVSLKAQLGAGALTQNELNQLKAQANLPYVGATPSIKADVVLSTPSNFESSIVIDKGTSSGVADGMPVVSGSGLVGLVEQTARSSCVVMLITDPSMKIGVRFFAGKAQGEQQGVVDGEGLGNLLRAEYVSPVDIVHKGEIMYTSGLEGGIFPPDIPVGTISRISNVSGTTTPHVELSPLADLTNLQYVTVILWEPGS